MSKEKPTTTEENANMQTRTKPILIIETQGHVDHGKQTTTAEITKGFVSGGAPNPLLLQNPTEEFTR